MSNVEKRKYPRYVMDCTVLVVDGPEVRVAFLVDLSRNGALFLFKRFSHIRENDMVKFFFFDRRSGVLCNIDAKVVRVFSDNDKINAAVTFTDDIVSINKVLSECLNLELEECIV